MSLKKWGFFCAGAALGSIAVKLLADDEVKKAAARTAAAVLRAADDIYEDLYDIYDSALEYNNLKDGLEDDDLFDEDYFDDDEYDLTDVRSGSDPSGEVSDDTKTSDAASCCAGAASEGSSEGTAGEIVFGNESVPEMTWEDNL